jgi:hypothetical protein
MATHQTLGLTGSVMVGAGDILMISQAGDLQLNGTLSALSGVTILMAGTVINQTGGALIGHALMAHAAGNVDLPSIMNNVAVMAGVSDGGTFRYRNAGALMVGSVNGVDGVSTSGLNVGIHAGGDLHLARSIDTRDGDGNSRRPTAT